MSDVATVCGNCVHAAFSGNGVYCRSFNEEIFNEKVAEECGEFTPSRQAEMDAAEGQTRPLLRVLRGPADDLEVGVGLVDACESYLDSLPCSNWGRGYDITAAKSRRQAAEWLASHIRGVAEHRAS